MDNKSRLLWKESDIRSDGNNYDNYDNTNNNNNKNKNNYYYYSNRNNNNNSNKDNCNSNSKNNNNNNSNNNNIKQKINITTTGEKASGEAFTDYISRQYSNCSKITGKEIHLLWTQLSISTT